MSPNVYTFRPRSRERERLTLVSPAALDLDLSTEPLPASLCAGGLRVLPGDLLTEARVVDHAHLLCWLDGKRHLLLVDRLDLTPL